LDDVLTGRRPGARAADGYAAEPFRSARAPKSHEESFPQNCKRHTANPDGFHLGFSKPSEGVSRLYGMCRKQAQPQELRRRVLNGFSAEDSRVSVLSLMTV
jgi:hypothetical protein